MRMIRFAVPFLGFSLLIQPVFAEPTTQPIAPATQPSTAKMGDFLRFVDQPGSGGRLETADMVFVNDKGAVVRLVSAVHIGETSYFQGLADSFKTRDAVLYEMVKPREIVAPKMGERTGSGVGDLQRFMKDTLALDYQLDVIDYTAPNFVHADLDAETFQKLQVERGETFEMMFMKAFMKAMNDPQQFQPQQGQPGGGDAQDTEAMMEDLVKMITRPDMSRQIKLILARHLAEADMSAFGFDGPGGSVIIHERNKAAIDVLKESLKQGKEDIAIFYGAAHMPDMSARLIDLGFKPVATEWRQAWDLTIRADQPSAVEEMLMQLIRGLNDPIE
jgi:hypothetical protein